MSEMHTSHVGGRLAAFATGTLIGAGLALAYAPHSGRETRGLLAQRARDAKSRVGEALDSTKQKVESTLHDAREKVGSVYKSAKDAFAEKKAEIGAALSAGREAMREEREHPSKPA